MENTFSLGDFAKLYSALLQSKLITVKDGVVTEKKNVNDITSKLIRWNNLLVSKQIGKEEYDMLCNGLIEKYKDVII